MRRSGKAKPVVWRWQAGFMAGGADGLTRDNSSADVGLFGWGAQEVRRIKLQVVCHRLENVIGVSFQCPAIVLDTVHKGLIEADVLSHLVR